jgi:sulfane dehydrogenase subunit SoxC
MRSRRKNTSTLPQQVAGNGLLDRRALLGNGVMFAGVLTAAAGARATGAAAEPLKVDPWNLQLGALIPPYSTPSPYEAKVVRRIAHPVDKPGNNQSRTPLHLLDGMITPSPLHFVITRSGAPNIDPEKHRLLIHGKVRQPLVFSLDDLMRYPMESRITFVECGGNSAALWTKDPIQDTVQAIHGLASCSEWTGIRLSTLLDQAGADLSAGWIIAEGADMNTMQRSIPMRKALDDAMLVFYQNGQKIMPWNGYPLRLLLPGYEGNMNVKYLRRLEVSDQPVMAVNETIQYTELLPDGKSWRFIFPMGVKSVITNPSPMMTIKQKGYRQITGLAWSAHGAIEKVEVSADGGKSWAMAALQEPVLSKAFTRFRIPWQWDGTPCVLASRATDTAGNIQPTRAQMIAERGAPRGNPPVTAFPMSHVNVISTWAVEASGEVKHVYI